MEQLVFDLAAAEPPSFANFVVGANVEVVSLLGRAASGTLAETGILVWGPPGSGRSHLLAATAAAARAAGRVVVEAAAPGRLPPDLPDGPALVAVDDVETADAEAQARLFSAYNALREAHGTLVVAANAPPASLPLRDDVRTRLAWGLVHEVAPLADEAKPAALAAWARARGYALGDEVIAYLLARHRRDMRTLVAVLESLDRRSLALKRPVTVALLREWMQRSIDERGPS